MDTVLINGNAITLLPDHIRAMTVHDAADCAGRECVIHNPTEHSMRGLPLHWRDDRGIFERTCPHGIGHPDPDQRAYFYEQGDTEEADNEGRDPDDYADAMMTHGCDGCCRA